MRNDGQAFYKHATEVTQLGFSGDDLFQAQVGRVLQTFGLNSDQVVRICESDRQSLAGTIPRRLVSRYYEAGPYTFIISFGFIDSGVGLQSISTKVAAGPTQEYDQLAAETFVPIKWVQFPGGGGQPECNDGRENETDQLVDYPRDPQCGELHDPSESN